MALPDPRRRISRQQVEVLPIEDGYMLRASARRRRAAIAAASGRIDRDLV